MGFILTVTGGLVVWIVLWALGAKGVDAFLLGSELKGLTRVRSASGVYPAVNALVSLAGEVKAIVGDDTVLTYGADWTEYGAHVVEKLRASGPATRRFSRRRSRCRNIKRCMTTR